MKALNKITLRFLVFIPLAGSYQNEIISQNCKGENVDPVETFYTGEFEDLRCELQDTENVEKQVTLVITTQADLDKYLTCPDPVSVDFDKYFILAGVFTHHQCAVLNSQQVLICNNASIVYRVRMVELECHAVTPVFYATAIDRKYLNLPVEFDVEFRN